MSRSVKFYHERLGLDIQFQSDAFTFLDGGSVTVSLSTAHAKLAEPLAGATELVFHVEGVREAHQALTERGVTFMNEPRNVTGDQWAANFRDPDGHLLSVFGPERQA